MKWLSWCSIGLVACASFAEPPAGYRLVWCDEFDGSSLNRSNWNYRTDVRHWSTQLESNAVVRNGQLELHLRAEPIGTTAYTGAGVISRPTFLHGYYEARFRVPPGAGWHTSFWLMQHGGRGGASESTGGARQEIDICEQDSFDSRRYTFALHDWTGAHRPTGGVHKVGVDLSADFHVWSCTFTPEEVRYYFDGQFVRAIDLRGRAVAPHSIWLTSIASWLGGTKAVDETKLPAMAVFDYVRYYAPDDARHTDPVGSIR